LELLDELLLSSIRLLVGSWFMSKQWQCRDQKDYGRPFMTLLRETGRRWPQFCVGALQMLRGSLPTVIVVDPANQSALFSSPNQQSRLPNFTRNVKTL
jgi:hypothetical protein